MKRRPPDTVKRILVAALAACAILAFPAMALAVGTPLTSAIWTDNPDIWGNRVVYSQKNLNEQWRTYVYDLSTKKAVALSGAQIESHIPSLHGNRASGTEASWALGQINVVAMDVVSLKQWVPAASLATYTNGIVVSACDNNDRWVIFRLQVNIGWGGLDSKEADFLYDTETGQNTYLTPADYASPDGDRPSLSDRWAVWSATTGPGPSNIYYYDLQNPPAIHQLTDVASTGGAIGLGGRSQHWRGVAGDYGTVRPLEPLCRPHDGRVHRLRQWPRRHRDLPVRHDHRTGQAPHERSWAAGQRVLVRQPLRVG